MTHNEPEDYLQHLTLRLLPSKQLRLLYEKLEDARCAGTPRVKRTRPECEEHARQLLWAYWNRQQAWVKRATPYVESCNLIYKEVYRLEFTCKRILEVWKIEGGKLNLILWAGDDMWSLISPVLQVENANAVEQYLRTVWQDVDVRKENEKRVQGYWGFYCNQQPR